MLLSTKIQLIHIVDCLKLETTETTLLYVVIFQFYSVKRHLPPKFNPILSLSKCYFIGKNAYRLVNSKHPLKLRPHSESHSEAV